MKVKSRKVSPDGSLGGKGYIQKIPDMRRGLMNCVESLSGFTDTLFDEVNGPHWHPEQLPAPEKEELEEIVEDVQEIRADPEGFAEEQQEEDDEEGMGKTAGSLSYRGDTPLDKAYAMTDLLIELGKDLPSGSSRSREFKAVQTALRQLESFVRQVAGDPPPRPRAAQTARRKAASAQPTSTIVVARYLAGRLP